MPNRYRAPYSIGGSMNNQKCIVVVGNPVEGFEYHGPFDDTSEATIWGVKVLSDSEEWWAVPIMDPDMMLAEAEKTEAMDLPKEVMMDLSGIPVGI